ncbi:hypothetical protein [Trinickia sp. Y13]|nr:hypothetical protein [Trinickia sp. Y13]MDG0024931.1 hypothetical protein [Trinickia sp. Y13]
MTTNADEVLNVTTELDETARDAMSAVVAVKLPSSHMEFSQADKCVFTQG